MDGQHLESGNDRGTYRAVLRLTDDPDNRTGELPLRADVRFGPPGWLTLTLLDAEGEVRLVPASRVLEVISLTEL